MTYSSARIQKMCICYSGRIDQADVRDYIAQHFDLVDCNVYSATDQYGYTSYAQTVKNEAAAYGRTLKVIGYYDSIFTTSSNGAATDSPWYKDLWNAHYDWHLNQAGGTGFVTRQTFSDMFVMNWKSAYSSTTDGSSIVRRIAATLVSTSAYDGIFFDDFWCDPDYDEDFWTPDTVSWEETMANWLNYSYSLANTLRNYIDTNVSDGSNKIIMPNVIDGTHMDDVAGYTRCAFHEHFGHKLGDSVATESRTTAALKLQIGYVSSTAKNDDMVAVFAGCSDGTSAQQSQLAKFCYALLCFSIKDPEKSYFAWQYMGDTPTTDPCWFSFMDMELGYPINGMTEVPSTTDVYYRTFDNFYVIANLSSLGDAAETFSLSTITGKSINLTLDARDAYFLPRKSYFVSKAGSDTYKYSGAGGSKEAPWSTITHAIKWVKKSGSVGDDIYIRSGSYKEKTIIDGWKSGSANNYCVITSYKNESVLISGGKGGAPYDGIFEFEGASSYIHISGLSIAYTGGHGIFFDGDNSTGGHHVIIDYCTIYNCSSSGIYAYGGGTTDAPDTHHIEVAYNTVYNVNNGYTYGVTLSPQEALSFSHVFWPEVHHNTLYNYGKEGIDFKSGVKSGSIHHNIIKSNRAPPAHNWDWNHLAIYSDGFSSTNKNIQIYNNFISSNAGDGIDVGGESSGHGSCKVDVYNNIIFVRVSPYKAAPNHYCFTDSTTSKTDAYCSSLRFYSNTVFATPNSNGMIMKFWGDSTHLIDNKFYNNIFTVGGSNDAFDVESITAAQSSGRLEFKNNIFYKWNWVSSFNCYWTTTTYNYFTAGNDNKFGASTIFKNPLYIHSGNNWHLQSTSPAIDSGSTLLISTYDYDDILRSYNGTYDIGAYEYDTSQPEEEEPTSGNLGFHGVGRLRFYNIGGNKELLFLVK